MMEFLFFFSIIALTVLLVATHVVFSPEMYWMSTLPNTPMPETLKDLLPQTGGGATIHGVCGGFSSSFHNYEQINYAKYKRHLHRSYSNESLFFLERDLKADHKMNLLFMHNSDHVSFLPRQVVKSIPFSSTKMGEILNKFAVKRGSVYAELMKITIEHCEEAPIKGEEKKCATSLESMVDYVTSKLGKSVKALSIEAAKEKKEEKYTIMHGEKVGERQVVCHKLYYAHAVFYCHIIENTTAYAVLLEDVEGNRMKAFCVCHRDTSDWNPKHLAFELLKVKPGTVPVCHFLTKAAVMWVPKQN